MSALRTIAATRYVTPLREGGSLPAIVEAEDDGLYVLKFRGAGQGAKALVAELVAGSIARALGLPIPELVLAELDPELARTEPDPEIQQLIRDSAGLNLAMDYLPGAVAFDPAVDRIEPDLASAIVWFDAYVMNVDRTARNTNLLVWHGGTRLIDHGAALYFHHDWDSAARAATNPFAQVRDHVLLPAAERLGEIDEFLAGRLGTAVLGAILATVPDEWLVARDADADPAARRVAYVEILAHRLRERHGFVQEAIRARNV